MDFGGSTLNKYYNARNDSTTRTSRRITSDVFALATAVLFQSPVQHFALTPNNLTDAPEWAINFMKEVPSTWDEVRFWMDIQENLSYWPDDIKIIGILQALMLHPKRSKSNFIYR